MQRSYMQEMEIKMEKAGAGLCIHNWKISSYLNKLAERGFLLQRFVEEAIFPPEDAERFQEGKYYSAGKASFINPTIIVKARKI